MMKTGVHLLSLGLVLILFFGFGCTEDQHTEKVTVQQGDMVKLDYTMILDNGTLIATTFPDIAKANNITPSHNGPITLFISPSEKQIPQILINELIGKENGTHGVVVIPNLYGQRNESLVYTAPYRYRLNLTENVSIQTLEHRLNTDNITEGMEFHEKGWNSTVVNITDGYATVLRHPHVNDTFVMNGVAQKIVEVREDEGYAVVQVDVEDGETLLLPLPGSSLNSTKEIISALRRAVIHVDEKSNRLTIDFNHPYAGHFVTVEYWIRDIVRT